MAPKLAALILFTFFSTVIAGQEGKPGVSGIVVDSMKTPVSLAIVTLKQNGKIATTAYTNTHGQFLLKADTGRYLLVVTHLSFLQAQSDVHIRSAEERMDTIVLSKSANVLQSVTVTARKALIELKDDRVVYNAENDPSSRTGFATDILRRTPMVTVDGDGNVQLNGQSNFKILLNGRETSMFALNAKDALKNFPGALITQVEVITAPSAKYDAEGVGGIINIITKKRVTGYNGSVNSLFTTRTNYNESISVNAKTGRLGMTVFAATSGRLEDIQGRSLSVTTAKIPSAFTYRSLDGESWRNNRSVRGNLELVYDIDSFKVVSVYGHAIRNQSVGRFSQTLHTQFAPTASATGLITQDNQYTAPASGFGADYIQKFAGKPGRELSFRVNGQLSTSSGSSSSEQQGGSGVSQQRYVSNESKVTNSEYTLQGDYILPLKNGHNFETGVKMILREASSDFTSFVKYRPADFYVADLNNSDRFHYTQDVFGLYASLSLQMKKGSARMGLRLEHTKVNGDFETSGTVVDQRYTNLVPNLLITHRIHPGFTLSGSYNMRLQRPSISNLNPLINNNDSLNISFGNPGLSPQVLHSISFQARASRGSRFVAVTLNGSYTNNMIVQYALFDPATGVTAITSANLGRERMAALLAVFGTPVSTKVNISISTQLRHNQIENRTNLLQHSEGFSGSMVANCWYKAGTRFSIFSSAGFVRGPYQLVGTPSVQPYYQVDLTHSFFREKLMVTMSLNNLHYNWLVMETVTEDPTFRTVTTNRNPYSVINFGATFRFGKLKENVSKKKGVNNDDLL
jgi:outer membrane receptor protein involved in Fe transport